MAGPIAGAVRRATPRLDTNGDTVHPVRTGAHWGDVISGDFSRPDRVTDRPYLYRVEGVTPGASGAVSVWMYDPLRKGVPQDGDHVKRLLGPGSGLEPEPGHVRTVPLDVLHADLDADTDSDGVLTRSHEEEAAEQDGVSAAAVPYNPTPDVHTGVTAGDATRFAPLALALASPIDPAAATVRLTGDAAAGSLRLWRAWDGTTRDPASVAAGGDLIPLGGEAIAASLLGLSESNRTASLFAEGLIAGAAGRCTADGTRYRPGGWHPAHRTALPPFARFRVS